MNQVDNVGMMKKITDFAIKSENNEKGYTKSVEKSKMDEIRCRMLEMEVENLKKKNKELEEQITRIQKVMSNEEKGKDTIVDLTGDEDDRDEFIQLMIENKVLECEKMKAETEVCFYKEKVKQLASRVCELESKLNMKGMNESSIDELLHLDKGNEVSTPKSSIERPETGAKQEYCCKVRKRLPFGKNDCSNKKFAPSTPGFTPAPSYGVIDISDEDVSYNHIPKVKNLSDSILKNKHECSNLVHIDEDDMDGFTSGKRKRSSNMVTSDDETSDDDNALICTLIKKDYNYKDEVKEGVSKRPLKRLRKLDDITIDVHRRGSSSSEDDEDDESLGGFIVESGSESEFGSADSDSCDESEDGIDEYKETLDKIRRKKDLKLKWDLEGDMLADFGKDPELCMRAVCVLYRQQTADEKATKGTIYHNARGFSHTDAFRGSKVAEFLTDGDSNGDLNKTVEELKRYDTKGIDLCMALAVKYSKQLFEIYQKKEDPYFLP